MQLIQSKRANINYLAKVVYIKEFRPHNNLEVQRLKCCSVDGFNIITGINAEPGYYIYFPALCRINPDFLSYANLYKHKELNRNPEESGMFEENGRVKAIKLKGEISEGFIISAEIFQSYVLSVTNKELIIDKEVEFDSVEDTGKEFWVVVKYIPKRQYSTTIKPINNQRYKVPKRLDRVREDQFRFHYDTILIRKCPYVISPEDIIQLSYKIHGTSGISTYVLCHQPLNIKQKIAKWLTKESFDRYDYIYASRTVIKNKYYNPQVGSGFYGNIDIWAEADKIVRPHLQKGQTAFYEIVGFLPNGKYIQNMFDYGCVPPEEGETFTHEKHFKVRIYRVTQTNVDGIVHEYSTQEVQQWCAEVGLTPVEECYYGKAKDLYPDLDPSQHWTENFINRLANDANFYMECLSPHCSNKVPHEGVVIKIEDGKSRAYKLKCFKFLDKEQFFLDKGEINIEDEA